MSKHSEFDFRQFVKENAKQYRDNHDSMIRQEEERARNHQEYEFKRHVDDAFKLSEQIFSR